MPCFVTTNVGDTLNGLVRQYQNLNFNSSTKTIEEIANLNQVSSAKILPPYKTIVLPDAGTNGMCGSLDYQAVTLARTIDAKEEYDPLKKLMQSGWGNELLASIELVESVQADSLTKAAFGGAVGASEHLYSQFLSASDNYKRLLKEYASANAQQRSILKKQIANAAKAAQDQYHKVVGVFVSNRKGSLPQRWKEIPHTDMYHVKNRGKKSTVFNSSKELDRVRWAARSAKVIGAGALFIDIAMAGTAIKHAHETGGNTTKVAFEEIGGITLEAIFATGGAIIATALLAPLALIPGVGILVVVGVGATGAIGGNILGKKLGLKLYDAFASLEDSSSVGGVNFGELNAI